MMCINDESQWTWSSDYENLGYCLNFTKNLSVKAVLSAYGADPETLLHLTESRSREIVPSRALGTVLRLGKSGDWVFCFEYPGAEGMNPCILEDLASNSETISFVYSSGGSGTFQHLRHGSLVTGFDIGEPQPNWRGSSPHLLTEAWAEAAECGDQKGSAQEEPQQILRMIRNHFGPSIDDATLAGTLATAFLPEDHRRPFPPPQYQDIRTSRAGLGRALGAVVPHAEPPQDVYAASPIFHDEPVGLE
ncbi:DUF6461 domain-containing protein [Streptomyces celluloflavus]|uniref:DUF6461 domain-containing protein n=1 Tax=Streptomyces celluloflavus TaxID=58344 RepID=UPI00364A025B